MGFSILHLGGLSNPVQLTVMEVAPDYVRVQLGLLSLAHVTF